MNFRNKLHVLCLVTLSAVGLVSCEEKHLRNLRAKDIDPPIEMVNKVSYKDIEPLFRTRCVACHGTAAVLNLETYQNAKNALSKIQQVVIDERRMPKPPFRAFARDELLTIAAWIESGGREAPSVEPDPLSPDFASIKKHILEVRCLVCHSEGGNAARVPLETREDLINSPLEIVVPGKADESGIILVVAPGARKPMPPTETGMSPVTASEIEILQEWINKGANL